MLAPCPSCTETHHVYYYVVKVATCAHCGHYSQMRAPVPKMLGGLHMIIYLTDRTLERIDGLPRLKATLKRALAKVERREAKLRNKNHGGAPKLAQDWR